MHKKVRHIVIFKLYEGIDSQVVINALKSLADNTPYLLEARVEHSLDTRKGNFIVENFLFNTEADFLKFRTSLAHSEVSDILKNLCDWSIADYYE